MEQPEVEELRSRYEQLRETFKSQTYKVGGVLRDLLAELGLPFLWEARTKHTASFIDKAVRGSERYTDPLVDITDISAFRVILLLPTDVDQAITAVKEANDFEVDDSRSVDKGADFATDRFGYKSKHLILRLSESRRGLREFADASGWVEVQVRTITQHAWAVLDHTVRYKTVTDLGDVSARRLFALAAVLELVERETAAIVRDWHAAVQAAPSRLAETIDNESVGRYLADSGGPGLSLWLQELARHGLAVDSVGSASITARMSRHVGLATIDDLDAMISTSRTKRDRVLRAFLATYGTAPPHVLNRSEAVWLLLIAGYPNDLTAAVLQNRYEIGPAWRFRAAVDDL